MRCGRLTPVTRLLPLDGLRGLAVLLVLASHGSNVGLDLLPGLHASGLGFPGVFLFFVLSSFLLTGQLLDRADRLEPIGWPRFGARRLLRILPAYALALGVHVILGVFAYHDALQHLLMVQARGHFWTIPVEVFFYLTLPLLVLVLRSLKGPWLRAAVLLVAAALARWAFPPDFLSKREAFTPMVAPFLPVFLVGATLAVLRPCWLGGKVDSAGPSEGEPAGQPAGKLAEQLAGQPAGRQRLLRWLGTGAFAAMVGMTPAIWYAVSGEPFDHRRFHLHFDLLSGLWALVIVAALQDSGWLRAFASWAPLRWLGQVSYSVYLFHALVLGYFVERGAELGLPKAVLGPAFLVGAVLVGSASYFLVERPFLRALRPRGAASN